MPDRFQNAVEVPDVLVDASTPETGYMRFYGRNRRPVARNSDGRVFELASKSPGLFIDIGTNSTPKSWTVPAECYFIYFELYGPGGAGAIGQDGNRGGGGGAAGAWLEGWLDVTPGDVIAYRIPAGNSIDSAYLLSTSTLAAGAGGPGTASGKGGGGGAPTIAGGAALPESCVLGTGTYSRILGQRGQDGYQGNNKVLLSSAFILAGRGGSNRRGMGGRGGRGDQTDQLFGGGGGPFGGGGGGCVNGSTPGVGGPAGLMIWY